MHGYVGWISRHAIGYKDPTLCDFLDRVERLSGYIRGRREGGGQSS